MLIFNSTKPDRYGGWFICLALLFAPAWAQLNYSTPYGFSTLAGVASIGWTDGSGSAARFYRPHAIAVDGSGNFYVADTANHAIRKITPAGAVTTLAGSAGTYGTSDGTGSAARFDGPGGVAVDASGVVYVADTFNFTIRKITPAGVVTTFAGLAGSAGTADGTGSDARFSRPMGLAIDATGNVYVADDVAIRKITPAGVVSTLAGGSFGSLDGTGSAAQFGSPEGVVVDSAGNVYVADTRNNTVRKITPAGVVTTLAGSAGSAGAADGTGGAARFNEPTGVAVDSAGNVHVADSGNATLRKITSAGLVTTLAGSAGAEGSADGSGSAARFFFPQGVAVDSTGNVYAADAGNNAIRRITPAGGVTTFAGVGFDSSHGNIDGTGSAARFRGPEGIAVGPAGELYVTDFDGHTIRKITPAGVVTTFAGADGMSGTADGTGNAARFFRPEGVAVDAAGSVYVADTSNHTIRKITPAGAVTTVAGLAGVTGSADGIGNAARFNLPTGLAADAAGNIYIVDRGNGTLRQMTPGGAVTTLAGSPGARGSVDGTGSAARFDNPRYVAVDAAGNAYVTELINGVLRKVTPDRVVTKLAGSSGIFTGSVDGTGSAARFYVLTGVAVDAAGTIYLAENGGNFIRKVTPSGEVSTLAGAANPVSSLAPLEGAIGAVGNADGSGREASFEGPWGIAVDKAGNLYVASGTTVRKGSPPGPPVITTQPQSLATTEGSAVQFTVVATGGPSLGYQWYVGGNPVSGATSNTLGFTSARTADAGDYTVTITNPFGTVTSSKATLTVTTMTPVVPPPAPSGGGGGTMAPWFALAWLMFLASRRYLRTSA